MPFISQADTTAWTALVGAHAAARRVIGALVLTVGVFTATAASAHGPCRCLTPTLGKPGEKVTISGTPAYKVIFNPRPKAYGVAMRQTGYHSAYRAKAPTAIVVSRPRTKPIRSASFDVPDAPPGVYLVLIFDGTERGTHTTWEYYHVLGRPPGPRDRAAAPARAVSGPDDADAGATGSSLSAGTKLAGIAVALGLFVIGAFLGMHWRS